jgi:hypothetical protein
VPVLASQRAGAEGQDVGDDNEVTFKIDLYANEAEQLPVLGVYR